MPFSTKLVPMFLLMITNNNSVNLYEVYSVQPTNMGSWAMWPFETKRLCITHYRLLWTQ